MRKIIPDNKIADFLGKSIINTEFISIDLWSSFHILTGVFLAYILTATELNLANKFFFVLVLLVVWEMIEIAFVGVFFSHESMVNRIWDLLFGLGGFILFQLLR